MYNFCFLAHFRNLQNKCLYGLITSAIYFLAEVLLLSARTYVSMYVWLSVFGLMLIDVNKFWVILFIIKLRFLLKVRFNFVFCLVQIKFNSNKTKPHIYRCSWPEFLQPHIMHLTKNNIQLVNAFLIFHK